MNHCQDSVLIATGAALKGDGGNSKSESVADTKDQRNAIGESGIIAGQGGIVNLTIANPDGFAQLLTTGAGLFESSLEFAQNAQERAFTLAGESTRSEAQTFGLQVLKTAGPILLVVGIAGMMLMSKK